MTVVLALLCSQVILVTWTCWLAARVRRFSRLAFASSKRAQAPAQWESRLRDLGLELASLSSSYEKLELLVTRLNSRAGMRELRSDPDASNHPPPVTASKAEKYRYYGIAGRTPRDIAQHQLNLESDSHDRRPN